MRRGMSRRDLCGKGHGWVGTWVMGVQAEQRPKRKVWYFHREVSKVLLSGQKLPNFLCLITL